MNLPLSAIIPVYNCRERLERHLQSVVAWAPSVGDLIVVDSGSTDGTLELAERILKPFGAKILQHPPGLYQSWNAGIASASATWCYISTVEDPISPAGLAHLLEVAGRHQADVVISPPEMRNDDGSAPVGQKMPSNRLAEAFLQCDHSNRMLNRAETIANLCGFLPHGLMGSSASNLYRTSFLQKHPFPVTFGHCGDTAWGVTVAPFAKVAFTPVSCARFYCQTNFRPEDPERQRDRHCQLALAARRALEKAAANDSECAVMLGWFDSTDHSMRTLWNWLAEQHSHQIHLQAKYEGGIFQYLKRAAQDEWRKLLK
jgi:hypothetical protein